jgi:ABC-type proline/glycine betaine transport system ATPase subunit
MALVGAKKRQRQERANELLKLFGITKLAERCPEDLSRAKDSASP